MIYCVEDERNIRELLIYTLETTGFKARGFGNGNELMKALKEEIPELILLDIMLPGDDGYTIHGTAEKYAICKGCAGNYGYKQGFRG